jgi:predicted transcriptional regulator
MIMTEPEILTTIKDHMKSAAITHEMAADLSGLKQSNISRMLSGRYSPNLKTLLRLADAVGVEIKAEVNAHKMHTYPNP